MCATSPGLWPVSKIVLRADAAIEPGIVERGPEPRDLGVGQDALAALGLVAVDPRHGLTATISCFIAQVKIAEAAART